MAARRGRPRKLKMNLEDTKKWLIEILDDSDSILGINWDNYKQYEKFSNCYTVTAKVMSLRALVKLIEHKNVKEVFYHPSFSPPGAGMDPIALRYRLYVQFSG